MVPDRAFFIPSLFCVKTMSTSYQYGDVSPARYPDLESKRKRRGVSTSAHPGGKKKKESKKKETVTAPSTPTEGTIQQLVPVGLDAFAKDHVEMEQKDPLTLLEEARQGKLTDDEDEAEVTVLQEGGSGPPSTQDQETQTALQSLLDELIEPLPPLSPSPADLPDYLVCPYHICHLENRVSQNGWHYAKCCMYPCLLFCAEEKAPAYMRAVHEQVHSDLLKMWKHLLCFCCKPPTLNQSRSVKNPDRLYLCCSKKKCQFFHWSNLPLTRRYKDWLEHETRESPVYLPSVTRVREAGADTVGHHPGREPWVTKALEAEKLEKKLNASLATAKVPRAATPYEEELIQEIRRLKEAARPPPLHDVPVPDRPLSDSERRRVGELRQTKEGLFVDGRKVGWHNF